MGLPKDLNMTGEQPSIALTVFFVPYVLFEVPSNLCLKRFNPHIWLPACISAFGIVMLCQGFVQSYGGLIVTRFFLGLAEAGIFPASFYLISFWYRRDEAQKRFTIYWSSVLAAGSFGGLLASAITNMDGIRGLSDWRWVFILEGILSIIVAIIAFVTVTDFPTEAKWLTPEEKEFIVAKTHADEPHTVPVTLKDVKTFFMDIKIYLGALMYFGK
jgi:MFS family permease